jgi:hypothetical protein
VEIAGQAALSAYGLRAIGIESFSFARPHSFDYAPGPDIQPSAGRLGWLTAAAQAARNADIFHFYFAQSFLPYPLHAADARLLRLLGRRVVVEFMGSDVRMPSLEAQRNPYYVALDIESDDTARRALTTWSGVTSGHAIICDRALAVFLAPHFEHIHVVPFRVDTASFSPIPPDPQVTKPTVVHAPSDLSGKGTRHLRAAVQALQASGVEFDYVELHGMSHEEVIERCRRADIVVDQLCSGSHGVFAVEAMSMAKPVICYLHPDVTPMYPDDLPIIQANPETLPAVLSHWLGAPHDRHALGLRSRSYAEREHDVRRIARRLLDVYAQLPGRS